LTKKSVSKKTFFTAIDKDGIHIVLEKQCWYGHILVYHKHQMRHRLLDIKAAIEDPDRVDENIEEGIKNKVYFKRQPGRDRFGNSFLLVATEIVENNLARVLSAYPIFALPPKGGK
jgi:hypothetical protein